MLSNYNIKKCTIQIKCTSIHAFTTTPKHPIIHRLVFKSIHWFTQPRTSFFKFASSLSNSCTLFCSLVTCSLSGCTLLFEFASSLSSSFILFRSLVTCSLSVPITCCVSMPDCEVHSISKYHLVPAAEQYGDGQWWRYHHCIPAGGGLHHEQCSLREGYWWGGLHWLLLCRR